MQLQAREQLDASQIRLEFVDGVVYAMAGGSPQHNRVVMRFGLSCGVNTSSPSAAFNSNANDPFP